MKFWEQVFALLLAVAIVVLARREKALTRSGVLAALIVGTICAAAGAAWVALLLVFFVSANLLSRYRASLRDSRIAGIVEKGNERDGWQVLSNGGVFAAAALLSLVLPSRFWILAGVGTIAAVTADTWSTEIGTVSNQEPRLITTRRKVLVGTSGGVTVAGSLAAVAGAVTIAVVVLIAGWGFRAASASIIGGMVGSLTDSLLGATIQRRRWCPRCETLTERLVHRCGTTTVHEGGIAWIGNDAVNAAASLLGAIAGLTIAL